jgi:DsbC/DsbD-like thiol-disulfide interchange protein
MLRPQIFGCVALGLMSALVLNGNAGEKSDSKIKATATAAKPGADGKQKVTVTIAIQKSWYIYANPVKSEDFEENATRVTFLQGKDKLKATVSYPAGKTKEVGKIRYNIYEDKVVIDAIVQRAAGDTGPLTVAIEINSCSGGTCLAPATVRLTVP